MSGLGRAAKLLLLLTIGGALGCRSSSAPVHGPDESPADGRQLISPLETGLRPSSETGDEITDIPPDDVDRLLALAANCVAAGDEAEFAKTESAILLALVEESTRYGCDEGRAVLTAEVMDELDALSRALSAVPEPEEPLPPEPQPVSDDEIAKRRGETSASRYDLPVTVNAEVTSLINYYTGPYRDRFLVILDRAGAFLPYIRDRLEERGLPGDLAFLPVVESAFNPHARSRARAQGLWQFMSGTARLYGLRCTSLVDERNDPFLATDAAVAHLADLYARYDDWMLALAAYNSGAGRVDRAIKRAGGTRDFWALRRYLPRETRNYVPALWAVLVAAKNPQAFDLPTIDERSRCLARVPIDGPLELGVLAEHSSLAEADLVELNPALTYRVTPATGVYRLAIPCDHADEVVQALAALPTEERVRRYIHEVRKGDTLGQLARRYGSSVRTIMSASGISDPRRLRIGQKLVIPRDPGGAGTPVAASGGSYVVRRGDTLSSIARRFGTSVERLRHVNQITGSLIKPGEVLQLN